MIGLEGVKHVIVPRSCIFRAHQFLQEVGQRGLEGFTLWLGTVKEQQFLVIETFIPRQYAVSSETGILVTVPGEELFWLNNYLYENSLRLIAQIHSHPTEAYHSSTDELFPIATQVGCLSIVVPDFAQYDFSLEQCAVFRLARSGYWRDLSTSEVVELIQIIENR